MSVQDWIAFAGVMASACAGALAAYVAIRVDMAQLRAKIESANTRANDAWRHGSHAHERIDAMLR